METIDRAVFIMMYTKAEAAIESVVLYRSMILPSQARVMLEGLELMFEEIFIVFLKRLL